MLYFLKETKNWEDKILLNIKLFNYTKLVISVITSFRYIGKHLQY